MVPFYGWGSMASRVDPLRRGSLLFTNKFPEIYGTILITYQLTDSVDFSILWTFAPSLSQTEYLYGGG